MYLSRYLPMTCRYCSTEHINTVIIPIAKFKSYLGTRVQRVSSCVLHNRNIMIVFHKCLSAYGGPLRMFICGWVDGSVTKWFVYFCKTWPFTMKICCKAFLINSLIQVLNFANTKKPLKIANYFKHFVKSDHTGRLLIVHGFEKERIDSKNVIYIHWAWHDILRTNHSITSTLNLTRLITRTVHNAD